MNKLAEMVADYQTGKYSIASLASKHKVSVGKTYYMLRDAGCTFSKKRKKELSEESRAHISAACKGRKLTPEQIAQIRERNSCDFNGLNGWGHVKKHNRGYLLAYAPKHPNAHKDGYVMLHTVVMEKHIGRYLNKDEVVHHINHVRNDNRIENLRLMTKKEHMLLHASEKGGMTYQ